MHFFFLIKLCSWGVVGNICMIKAFEIRFLKKINSHTKNHLDTKFQWNIHRVVLNFNLKTTWFGGFASIGQDT